MREKTIEQTYQKKTPLQHILLRPDTYVGSIEMEKSTKWILRENRLRFTSEEISYVPALYKIFDEVLVNAADNYQRDRKMNTLMVEINAGQGYISVHNNGKGIPVEIHKEENIYVPELIFGHLLTGSNYDDQEKKVVGGRNGYGAKLANIFSHRFIVECGDGKARKKFKMVWRMNMTSHGEAEISGYSGKDYTTVTFYPEFSRFKMDAFDDDILSLMRKRVYDMAGLLPSVAVSLNDRKLPINSFLKYVDMYFQQAEGDQPVPKIRDANVDTDRWQVVVSISDGEFRQVSFVNSICTSRGGTHVAYITDQLVQKIQEKLHKKDKNLNIKPFQIKAHLWIFVNALIENPTFDSQTKETLTLKRSQFGSDCPLSEKLIKEVLNTGIIDEIYNEAKSKELSKLAKMTGGGKKAKLTGIPKLEDANEAGTKNSEKCTLILTEGDSAKSLAMAGIEVIGRDYYGVFPLKGKLLNVREASSTILTKNDEIQNLIKIMGLQINKKYEDVKSLRYGSIMIMSDQDTDGSHIKGLVINFIHTFWPTLFQIQGFLKQFITPLLKATKGRQTLSFYTMSDFKRWAQGVNLKTWKIKYYKGLGTSTDKEAMEYFQQLQRSRIAFRYGGREDDQAMELIFCKKNAEKRKEWLSTYDPDNVMVYDRPAIGYKEFVDKQFIHFSNEDNNRSIASIIDGFKPGQRKIIFACFKRNLKQEIKVAQLAGYVAEHSAYHHGEMSLTMTIVNMAQSFVGSNNINLLMPNGQFGSRNQGGKDHASARYIFTNLNKVTRFIYPQADDHTLTYIEDDGQFVEPEYYIPIIPMGLVNGCEGIGSGWSTYVPNFNPRDIASMIVKRLNSKDQPFTELHPWYKGYTGTITLKTDGNYQIKGIIEFDAERENIIHVKELPINKWTKDYKQFLQKIMTEGNDKIQGLREYHTKNRVHFQVQMNQTYMDKNSGNTGVFQKLFNITANISMKNMVGFNNQKKLQRYSSSVQIMEEFYEIRLRFYEKRKDYLVSKLVREMEILSNKERFIIQVVEEKLIIRNKKRAKIVEELKAKGYTKFSQFPNIKSTKMQVQPPKNQEEDWAGAAGVESDTDDSKEYNYLLTMPLWNLTYEKVEEIKKSATDKKNELLMLEKTSIKEMWNADLIAFLEVLDKVELEEEEDRLKGEDRAKGKDKGIKAKKAKKEGKEKAKKGDKADKNEKKAINWDTDGQSQFDKKTEKPKAKKTKEAKEEKPKKQPKKQEPEDLMTRVKRKMEQSKKSANTEGSNMIAKPIDVKPKTMKTMFDDQDSENYQLVITSKAKRSSAGKGKGKKKMQVDSDSDFSEEWSNSD